MCGAYLYVQVYGALPPDARRQQAAHFNDSSSDVEVLVASDAIGMGLNLNIRRVIFSAMNKYNGESMQPLQVSGSEGVSFEMLGWF
jgi:ATP-dependent RNA helicase SUPV3L1/SUV3